MSTTEIFVSKLSFREDGKLIDNVFAYEFDGSCLGDRDVRQRHWLVNRAQMGLPICVLDKNAEGKWIRGNQFNYNGSIFRWGKVLPKNLPRRKTFVSYYHYDDQDYRDTFENIVDDIIISKSVEDGDINSDNADDYVKQLIQQQYLNDTILLVVLVGRNTLHRKHVDWEISGALDYKVGDRYSALCGILLPDHPDYGSDKFSYANLPARLAHNVKSKYATIHDWTTDRTELQNIFEDAINRRADSDAIINRAIPQMKKDTN